ncbi:hypothetical protein [Candidatus Protochlamydia phocaeensis]|uniref:hypothetical protein n=1 Tax=Candidatus Protochlamydia phocaeensis TaxID=1414722 RepID=UPI000837E08F|nr:hypothetical protein [Candidatus Protochlamydia phocaeensis]
MQTRTMEWEIDQVLFSIDNPQLISFLVSSEESYLPKSVQLELKDDDLELSKQFCDMLQKRLLENLK